MSTVTHFERIFTRLLDSQTGIKPDLFWSGFNPEDSFWSNASDNGREIFRNIYNADKKDANLLSNIVDLLNKSFSYIKSEQDRKNLTEPSFVRRLVNEKQILYISTACLIFGITMLIFAIWPATWVPGNIKRFNELIEIVNNNEYTDEVAMEFTELAEGFKDKQLAAASFYNSGTLMSDNVQMITADHMVTFGDTFENVADDERIIQDAEDLLEILTKNVDIFRQSELQLRESVRGDINEENFRRNLELVIKRRKAALDMINSLLDTGHVEPVKMDELLDLLESQMALDFELDEGQEAPGYYIGEEF
jgi:hypothetical protein